MLLYCNDTQMCQCVAEQWFLETMNFVTSELPKHYLSPRIIAILYPVCIHLRSSSKKVSPMHQNIPLLVKVEPVTVCVYIYVFKR